MNSREGGGVRSGWVEVGFQKIIAVTAATVPVLPLILFTSICGK